MPNVLLDQLRLQYNIVSTVRGKVYTSAYFCNQHTTLFREMLKRAVVGKWGIMVAKFGVKLVTKLLTQFLNLDDAELAALIKDSEQHQSEADKLFADS